MNKYVELLKYVEELSWTQSGGETFRELVDEKGLEHLVDVVPPNEKEVHLDKYDTITDLLLNYTLEQDRYQSIKRRMEEIEGRIDFRQSELAEYQDREISQRLEKIHIVELKCRVNDIKIQASRLKRDLLEQDMKMMRQMDKLLKERKKLFWLIVTDLKNQKEALSQKSD